MSISLIMLGAGNSSRFELPTKKQWLRTKNIPIWLYATKKLSKVYNFDEIIVVGKKEELNYMKKFANFTFCEGGNTRQKSLKNALKHTKSKYVLVSDIARVCVDKKLTTALIKAKDKADCIVPSLNVVDTVHFDGKCIDRKKIKRIQTPQLSLRKKLVKALSAYKEFTDDSSAILHDNGNVFYVNGCENAVKLTTKEDILKLSCLKKPSKDMFVGSGYDVHAFGVERKLILGGICVHETMGLKAHSDGDVLTHALIDAMLGAVGLGDIGELFPDTDEKYKNVNSMELLSKVYGFIQDVGFELVNCDITVLAQSPKLAPFKNKIEKNIARVLKVDDLKVNVKATTTEKLGFVGREEGIASQASATFKFYDWKKR